MARAPTQHEKIDRLAAEWCARLDSGNLSATDRDALRHWLSESREHRKAFRQMRQVNQSLSRLTETRKPRYRLYAISAAAASILGIALFMHGLLRSPPALEQIRTGTAEFRELTLADGSHVFVNARSHLQWQLVEHERRIRLLEGEAYFEVAPDAARPFIVSTPGGQARAVGTEFNVRSREDTTEITVAEGIVEVSQLPPSAANTLPTQQLASRVTEGQMASFQHDTLGIKTSSDPRVEEQLAWLHGKLIFDDMPLSEILQELSRYTNTRIMVSEPMIGQLRGGGVFDLSQPTAALTTLCAAMGLEQRQLEPGLIVLYRPLPD